MSRFEHVQFEVKRSVAHISLNRPDENLLNIGMIAELNQAVETAGENRSVKALLLTSKLKTFCLGLDLEDHNRERVFQLVDGFHSVIRNLHEVCIPSIAVVHGAAFGAGCSLATFCDFVLSTESSQFGHPEMAYGFIPTVSAITFPNLMGARKATELLLTGEILDARKAHQLGLVSHVLEDREVIAKLEALLEHITVHSAPILRLAVRSIRHTSGMTLSNALESNQTRYLNQLMDLQDIFEGMAAKRENRRPIWKND